MSAEPVYRWMPCMSICGARPSMTSGSQSSIPVVDGADRPAGQHVDLGHRRSFRTKGCYPPGPG